MAELLEGSKVLAVPLFQRRYSWGRPQWRALWTNIKEQYEYQALEKQTHQPPINHFIGSFVLSPVVGSGPPLRVLVVDGQQRLITVSALLAAIRDLRWERATQTNVRNWLEDDFTKAYLTNSILNPSPESRFRVLPTQEDRDDFASTIGETPGAPAGSIGEAYRYFLKEARARDYNGEPFDLDRLTDVVLSRLSLIEIRTELGDNVHRVFQTLNSSGVMLKQVDLLRNHFFMLLPTRADELYRTVWRDMELRLGETAMDKFFWASLVSFDSRVSRNTVFNTMQTRLLREGIEGSEDRVENALCVLNEDSKQYLKLIEPTEEPSLEIRSRLDALDRWGTDTYYPLGLRLLVARREGMLSEEDLGAALLALESFLVRRMLVGIPTNNLNRIFATLTRAVPIAGVLSWLRDALISVGKTWPDDSTIRASISARPFFFSGQPGQRVFVLERIDKELSDGSEPAPGQPAYELVHVMPATPSVAWPLENDDSGSVERDRLVNTLGNVAFVFKGTRIPAQADFSAKKEVLRLQDLSVNRAILESETWTERDIAMRSSVLAEKVIAIWPRPATSAAPIIGFSPISEDVALSMPVGAFTTVEDLSEFWSVRERDVLDALPTWSSESLSRVRRTGEAPSFASVLRGAVGGRGEGLERRLRADDLASLAEEEDAQNLEQAEE